MSVIKQLQKTKGKQQVCDRMCKAKLVRGEVGILQVVDFESSVNSGKGTFKKERLPYYLSPLQSSLG